jgi:F1F0 ATPase subunit 2
MNEYLKMIFALFFGLFIGGLFFGGLWWTVQKSLTNKRPEVLFLSSLVLRTALVLVGFYFIAKNNWKLFLVSFLGFLISRFLVNLYVRITVEETQPHQGNFYAPES